MKNNTLCNRHSLGVNNHTKMYVTYTRIYGWSDYGGESSYQPRYRLENMMWMTLLVYDYIIPVWDYMERTEQHRMYTENANRSSGDGIITPDNMEPNPKNPIIASFFRNIGWSDRLGSGVRNIFKYSKYYSGEEPEFVEGDVFRIIVPLNEDYSYDNVKNGDKKTAIKNGDKKISKKTIQNYKKILEFMEEGKEYTIQDFCNLLNLKPSRTKELLKALTQDIEQIGNNKNRKYRLK